MTAYSISAETPIAVIGAGHMGMGIVQLALVAGHPVQLFDTKKEVAHQARLQLHQIFEKAIDRQQFDRQQVTTMLARLTVIDNLSMLANCGLIIEAIIECLETKRQLFAQLETIVSAHTILASNTSSLSITHLAKTLQHPQRCIGWHFFNPATRMQLVEIIAGVNTAPEVISSMHALSAVWGKTSVTAPNTPGFIVNRVARPYYAEGLRLLAEDIADIPTIDYLARQHGKFAMGPFELMDLIGNDVNLAVTESVFTATAYDTRYAPHIIQQELVRAGHYGRKAAMGFYDYRQPTSLTAESIKPKPISRDGTPTIPSVVPIHIQSQTATLYIAKEMGLLTPLITRLQNTSLKIEINPNLPPHTMSLGEAKLMLSDGRTATHVSMLDSQATPYLLLDYAFDFATTPSIAISASKGAEASIDQLAQFLHHTKINLIVVKDVAGLVVLRLISCIINEAADLLTWTRTSAHDIDIAMRLGAAYPMGPLAWADLMNSPQIVRYLENLHAHYGDTRYRCAPKLKQLAMSAGKFYA